MMNMLAVARLFTLEVLCCLVILLSMAVSVLCIGGYRLIVGMYLGFVRAQSNTRGLPPYQSASALDLDSR